MKALVLLLALAAIAQAQDGYRGYEVLKTSTLSEMQAKVLKKFVGELDFWRYPQPGMQAKVTMSFL